MTSVLTGPDANIYAATTIPGTAAVAMTEFQAHGNSVILVVTTAAGGGCVSLTFTAECKYKIAGTDTAYADYIDRNSTWSMVVTTPTVAGVYAFPLEGLDLAPVTYCRLSYTANTQAGNVKVDMLNWDNPKGGGASVSVGDVVVNLDSITVNIEAVEQTHGDAVGADGFMQVVEAKDIDGSALPNSVTEGQVVRPAATLYGGTIATVTTEDGSFALRTLDDPARRGYVQVTDGTTDAAVIAVIESQKTDTSSVAGTVTDVNAGNVGAGSQRVTLATDDINAAAIKVAVEIMDDWDETDRAAVNTVAGQVGIAANTGVMDALTTRTTLATDDAQYGSVGAAADVDGTIHAQLRTIGTAVELLDDSIYADDGAWTDDVSKHTLAGGLYQSAPQTVTDGKVAPFEIDVNGNMKTNLSAQGLTAVKVSATAAANTAVNPLFSLLTDGAAAIDTTNPLSVNLTDGTDASLLSAANTGRAVGNIVLSTQEIGADGTVAPTGSLLTNAPFSHLTDGTTNVAVIAATTALKTDTSSIGGTAFALGTGAMAASLAVNLATDDTQYGAVGAAADPDGNIHGQLRSIAEGVVSGATVVSAEATGAGAISETTAVTTAFELIAITLHLSAAGTTAEDFTVGLDAVAGAAYDTNLLTLDLSTDSIVNMVLTPQNYPGLPRYLKAGDEIVTAWTNTEARTYGLQVYTKGV